jgi:hypothetical protein
VAREALGFLPAVYIESDVEQVALNQTITYPIVGAAVVGNVTPAATGPNPNGNTIATGSMTINKSRSVSFPWNGEEQASIRPVYQQTLEYQFEQAFRALTNEMEVDLAAAAKTNASRAYGAAGTTPFATAGDFVEFANTRRMLVENGCAMDDCHLVLNTTASTQILSKQSSLFKANEAGGTDFLRDARLGRVEQLNLHESAQIAAHTKGTGTNYVFNGSHAVGATTVVAKTGSGTVLAGDVLAFEDDANNKYVVNTGIAAPGSMVIGGPGLRQLQTDGKTITIGNNYTGNFAFHRYALHLLTRLPKMPDGGDAADDVYTLTDPYSGISFQIALYRQYRQVVYEVAVAWGTKATKSDFIVILLG